MRNLLRRALRRSGRDLCNSTAGPGCPGRGGAPSPSSRYRPAGRSLPPVIPLFLGADRRQHGPRHGSRPGERLARRQAGPPGSCQHRGHRLRFGRMVRGRRASLDQPRDSAPAGAGGIAPVYLYDAPAARLVLPLPGSRDRRARLAERSFFHRHGLAAGRCSDCPRVLPQRSRHRRPGDQHLQPRGFSLDDGRQPDVLFPRLDPGKRLPALRWNTYSELLILYVLGIGSPTHPISPRTWDAWRLPIVGVGGYTYVGGGPLFIHQYSLAWIDLRDRFAEEPPAANPTVVRLDSLLPRRNYHLNYFANSVVATRAQQELFSKQLSREFS